MPEYADTAWRGEQPFSCEFSVQSAPEDLLASGKACRAFHTILSTVCLVGFIVSTVFFLIAAFGSGLRLSVMINNPLFPALYLGIGCFLLYGFLFRVDRKKREHRNTVGVTRKASHRLISATDLKILDFKCRPSAALGAVSFKHGRIKPTRWQKTIRHCANYRGISWDEKELAYFAPSPLQGNMVFVQLVCWTLVVLGWPIIILHLLSLSYDEISVVGYVIFFLLSGAPIAHQLIHKEAYVNHRGPKVFSLSRSTGMVSFYQDGALIFSHQFIDFNCFYKQVWFGGRTGWVRSLFMMYRNEDYPYDHVVDLATFVDSTAESSFLEVWEVIKCYMNVTLPLPESLFLAPRRPFDSVSAEYDRRVEGSPTVTEDMSDSEYEALLAAGR